MKTTTELLTKIRNAAGNGLFDFAWEEALRLGAIEGKTPYALMADMKVRKPGLVGEIMAASFENFLNRRAKVQ